MPADKCGDCEFARWMRGRLGEDLSHSHWSDSEAPMGARVAHFIGTQAADPFCQVYRNEVRWARMAYYGRQRNNLAYVAHRVRGAFDLNIRRAREWVNWLNDVPKIDRISLHMHPDLVFVAPWMATASKELDAGAARARNLGLCARTAAACDEIWLVGSAAPSSGMQEEMRACEAAGGVIVRVTADRPPADPADLRDRVSRRWMEQRL